MTFHVLIVKYHNLWTVDSGDWDLAEMGLLERRTARDFGRDNVRLIDLPDDSPKSYSLLEKTIGRLNRD